MSNVVTSASSAGIDTTTSFFLHHTNDSRIDEERVQHSQTRNKVRESNDSEQVKEILFVSAVEAQDRREVAYEKARENINNRHISSGGFVTKLLKHEIQSQVVEELGRTVRHITPTFGWPWSKRDQE